jgi:hypothetical protein
MSENASRSVQRSVRVYEKLLVAYPAEFRQKYAREMALVFREMASEAIERQGILGLGWFWCRVLGDLLTTALQEQFANLHRRIIMKTAFRAFLWTLLAAFIHYFVFVSLGVLIAGSIFLFQGGSWFVRSHSHFPHWIELAIFLPPPFLSGMILARVQPFFRPYLTAPLGIMMICSLALGCGGVPLNSPFASTLWGSVAYYALGTVVVALIGLETLLGCITATKLSQRFRKAPIEPQAMVKLLSL